LTFFVCLAKIKQVFTDKVAKVELSIDNKLSTFQIVGADESYVKDEKIAFFSPVAKTIMGKRKDDKALLILGKEKRLIEIKQISYAN